MKSYNYEKMLYDLCFNANIAFPLKERRDYGEQGLDFIEQQYKELKNKKKFKT